MTPTRKPGSRHLAQAGDIFECRLLHTDQQNGLRISRDDCMARLLDQFTDASEEPEKALQSAYELGSRDAADGLSLPGDPVKQLVGPYDKSPGAAQGQMDEVIYQLKSLRGIENNERILEIAYRVGVFDKQ